MVIRASEVGRYVFCARAWWLARVKGMEPESVEELEWGWEEHLRHGRQVRGYLRLRRWALFLLIAALLLGALFLWSMGR